MVATALSVARKLAAVATAAPPLPPPRTATTTIAEPAAARTAATATTCEQTQLCICDNCNCDHTCNENYGNAANFLQTRAITFQQLLGSAWFSDAVQDMVLLLLSTLGSGMGRAAAAAAASTAASLLLLFFLFLF